MHFKSILLLASLQLAAATPIAMPQGTGAGADSCPSEDLTAATWTKNKVDGVLTSAAKNISTNNVQGLASSLGAPNFFCGLDSFCNAGQPCLPVTLPAWYGLVAIQNYNSYMNSLNTAVGFATSIMALEMPAVIKDFWPEPADNVTPLKELNAIVTFGLSVVPFTGSLAKVTFIATGVTGLLTGRMTPPVAPNLFVKWSDVGVSLASAAKDYQSAISTSLQNTLDAKIDDKDTGINALLSGGQFLGVAQNFTQADMQAKITDNMKLRSIALALQAQKAFIYRASTGGEGSCMNNNNDAYRLCSGINGTDWSFDLRIGSETRADIAQLILEKYNIEKKVFLQGPSDCFNTHGKQLFTPDILPLEAKEDSCIFNLQVCTFDSATFPGRTIQENCNLQNLDT